MGMTNEEVIEILLDIRAYYASLTVGYPKGKDTVAICGYMCSEVANACLTAVKALEQQPCEDCISRVAVLRLVEQYPNIIGNRCVGLMADIKHLPSVTPM